MAAMDPSRDAEHVALIEERDRLRKALSEAVALLDNARCGLLDPALRRAWGSQRKAIRRQLGK